MKRFLKGNVIKTKYNKIEIVISVDEQTGYTATIPLGMSNCTIGHNAKDEEKKETCYRYDNPYSDICQEEDCEDCQGSGEYSRIIYGMESAILLASTVKDYIINSLTKNFDF